MTVCMNEIITLHVDPVSWLAGRQICDFTEGFIVLLRSTEVLCVPLEAGMFAQS